MKHFLFLSLLVLVLAGAIWWFLGDHPAGGPDDPGSDLADAGGPGGGDSLRDPGGGGGRGSDGARPPDAPGVPPDGTRASAAVTVAGRVVDDRRRPVSGAEVEVRLGARRRGGGVTDADGTYAVSIGPVDARSAPSGLVIATAPVGRLGLAPFWTTMRVENQIVVAAVVVEPSTALRVRVVRDGEGVAGARVVVAQRTSGAPHQLGDGTTNAQGELRVGGLPRGIVEIFAVAPGFGRGTARATLPQSEGRVATLVLQGERAVTVRVVDAVTRRPVAGADVFVGDHACLPPPTGPGLLPPVRVPRTHADGRTRVGGLGAQQTVLVSARASGYLLAPWYADPALTLPPGKNDAVVWLRRFRTVRFPVAPGGAATPPDGSVLRVELGAVGERSSSSDLGAVLEDGVLVVRGLPETAARGVAIAAGGAQAAFTADRAAAFGPIVTFRAARTVVVRAVSTAGVPVPDVRLRLKPLEPSARIEPALTDAEGRALFPGVGCDRVGVATAPADQPGSGLVLATLDLTEERELYEVTLPAAAEVVLRLQVAGEPRLPGSYTLMAGGGRVPPRTIDEQPDEGVLRARVHVVDPDLPLALKLIASGYLPAEATLPPQAVGATHEFELELRPAAALTVLVEPPADGEYALKVERFADTSRKWVLAGTPGARPAGPRVGMGGAGDGVHRFEGLAAGRYRVSDAHSGVMSEEIVIALGGAAQEIGLDLSGAAWVEGRVSAPPGTNLRLARVLVEGRDDATRPWSGRHPDEAGTFKLRAVRGGEITVFVRHPRLRPARVGGRATVRPGGGKIDLRLEPGPEVRFGVLGLESVHTPERGLWYGPVRVLLFRGEPGGEPVLTSQPLASRGVFTFGGHEPGTYTLWIEYGLNHAPTVLKGAVLGDGVTDLGTLAPSEGARVRVRFSRAGDGPLPNVWMSVVRVGQPTYGRHATRKQDEAEIVCSGLGSGRFEVKVRVSGPQAGASGSRIVLEREVTLDGTGETVLDLRLR